MNESNPVVEGGVGRTETGRETDLVSEELLQKKSDKRCEGKQEVKAGASSPCRKCEH